MNQETTKIIESGLISKTKSDSIVQEFQDYIEIVEGWASKASEIIVTDETQTELMEKAKEAKVRAEQEEKDRQAIENAELKRKAVELEKQLAQQKKETFVLKKENKKLETQIASSSKIPDAVLTEIKLIDARVEEVCPLNSIDPESDSLSVFYTKKPYAELEADIVSLRKSVLTLQKEKEYAIEVFNYALFFIIHDDLRKSLESAIKSLTK